MVIMLQADISLALIDTVFCMLPFYVQSMGSC